jgi:hypothetical protein
VAHQQHTQAVEAAARTLAQTVLAVLVVAVLAESMQ